MIDQRQNAGLNEMLQQRQPSFLAFASSIESASDADAESDADSSSTGFSELCLLLDNLSLNRLAKECVFGGFSDSDCAIVHELGGNGEPRGMD